MTDQLRSGASTYPVATRPIAPEPHEHPVTDDFDEWLEQQSRQGANWDEIYPVPTDTASTDRLLGALRYLRRQIDDAEAVADARVADIRQWQQDRTATLETRVAHIERLLEGWARAQHELSRGRTKTWKLPSGNLTLRAGQPRLQVIDDERVAAGKLHATFGDVVRRVTISVDKAAVKARVTPGVRAEHIEAPEGYEAHVPMILGPDGKATDVQAPGVVLLVPTRDSFKVNTGGHR